MTGVKKSGCFLCNGPHRAKDYPTKGKINAIVAPPSEDKEEDTPADATILQILGAMRAGQSALGKVGLMFVPIVVNGRKVSTFVDTGAMHSFVSKGITKDLGLKTRINTSRIKAVNSKVK